MNSTNWICSAALIGSGLLNGCAHQQPLATTDQTNSMTTATRVQPQEKPPTTAAANLSTQMGEDLQALLDGSKIHFAYDQDLLTPDSEARLNALASKLNEDPTAKILISGNCDERGTEEYNLALGQRRADVAKTYLTRLGVDGSRIRTVTYGFERPADPAHTAAAWTANRRDEMQRQGI